MSEIVTVGLDGAKNVFQVHEADGMGRAVLRKTHRRAQVLGFSHDCLPASLPWKLVVVRMLGPRDRQT